ncbi:hypothetical protein FE783_13315 [Paenibacillus mesophilus]|uniref:hypothetical protein n=1 Tax=Paenibacillus mesophilus TaxID=2582849 RepID=UPI00110F1273|nr:hypothetical protein [Paenibacillus mesophilus]TMV49482.1 hypothetical protein FE783_13315 [Paenibacillus mesophilus]
MSVLIFLIFSMWEWFALIMLAFALYRFEIRYHLGQIVFASFLLALFSYMVFNVFELKLFATLIQPVVVFLFFWLLFKIPVFYAGIVVVNGYLAYCLVTSLIFYTIHQFGITSYPSTLTSYITQTVSGLLVLLLARVAVKYRIGFSFVQHGREIVMKNISGTNLKLLLLTIVGYIALSSFNILYYGTNNTLFILISAIVAFSLLQYWAFKKEHEAAFWRRNKKYKIDA